MCQEPESLGEVSTWDEPLQAELHRRSKETTDAETRRTGVFNELFGLLREQTLKEARRLVTHPAVYF